MKLSVIIPVYNEKNTIEEILRRIIASPLNKEIIVVNDGSTDGSGKILENLKKTLPEKIHVIHHKTNEGKGAAVRRGICEAKGELTIIQDADLEYDPGDYENIIKPFSNNQIQAVYGSRNLKKNDQSSFAFYWGGRFLSWCTNILYGSNITDEATCYKAFRTRLLQELDLKCNGFDFCPEVTAKILRRNIPIHEVPISYFPRTWKEGKKIKWTDGLTALWVLIKHRFSRRI